MVSLTFSSDLPLELAGATGRFPLKISEPKEANIEVFLQIEFSFVSITNVHELVRNKLCKRSHRTFSHKGLDT